MDAPRDERSAERETRRGGVPRGVEVLIKKAAVDPPFKALLLEERAAAAREIGLELEPAEEAMLAGIPAAQLEATIASTTVEPENRRAFMGKAAALMLAAVGGALLEGCQPESPVDGVRPDRPEPTDPDLGPTRGVQPDRPTPKPDPVAPEPAPTGSRPDRPLEPPMFKDERPDRTGAKSDEV